jgi:hypothetical protein
MGKHDASASQAEATKPAAPLAAEPPAPQPTAAVTQPPPTPEPERPKAPPPEVKIMVKSVPDSAEVYLDDSLVGNTPYPIVKPTPDKPSFKLELRSAGYENKFVVISARSNDIAVTLKKVEEKAAPHQASPRSAKRARSESGSREERQGHGASQTEVLDPWN